jgi:glycosyltransferase involved in cell wall biosynthesis
LIAGEGELFEESKARAAAEKLPVTFLGWRKDVSALFAASDIAILTSDNEGIPLTLIEAAQAGLPIVSTDVGSISDIVVDGQTGILTETNPEQLAQAIVNLASDEKKRIAMGSAGLQRAHTYFSLGKSLNDHAQLYKNSQN